ncbi:MAG TPA: autotransporter domain-containing protein, partial [Xanthobacteraceae bacterium]|nr:autotransporter domain-containing protein [Xanthobacteraceae bacterium]
GFRAGLANTWHFIDMQRSALAQTINSDYTARTFQTFGELGYRFDYRAAWLEPFANAAYVAHHTGAFTETGGTAALNIRNGDSDTGFTTLGLRGAHRFVWGSTAATARGALGWRHAFGDIVPVSTNSFVGGAAFTIAGAPIARDAAVVEAGFDFRLSEIAILGLGYAGQFAGPANSQSGRMKLSVNF